MFSKGRGIVLLTILCLALLMVCTGAMAATYPVWVGGTQFQDGALEIKDTSDGTAVYNPDTKTLTLNSYNYEGNAAVTVDGSAKNYAIYAGQDLNLVLNDTSSVEHTGDNSNGLYVKGSLTVKGEGELTAKGVGSGVYVNQDDITVKSGP